MIKRCTLKKCGAWFSSLFTSVFYPFQFKQDACTITPEKDQKPKPRVAKPKEVPATPKAVTPKKPTKNTQTTETTKSQKPKGSQ